MVAARTPASPCGRVLRGCSRRSRAAGLRVRRTKPWARGQYRPADPRRCRAVTEALRFWALIELIGLGAAPLAGLLLARLPGSGLGLGKALGLLLVTWLVWLGGTATVVPYDERNAALWIALVCAFGLLVWVRERTGRRALARGEPRGWLARRRWRKLVARVPGPDPLRKRLFWGAEAVFLLAFAAMALLVAYSPEIWNTEKPMDMAFLTASNRAETFPPDDPWLAGTELNYYYLGHLAMAVLVKLTMVAPDHGYNLAIAALFGADRRGGVHASAAPCGRRRAAPAARCGPGCRGRARAGGGQPGRRAAADRRRRAAARLRLVRPLARGSGHDRRVPVVLVPARRPARPRARAAVHAGGAGVRAPGGPGGPAPGGRGRALLEGLRRGAHARVPLRGELVVLSGDGGAARARRSGVVARPPQRAAPGRRPSAGCSPSWRGACC